MNTTHPLIALESLIEEVRAANRAYNAASKTASTAKAAELEAHRHKHMVETKLWQALTGVLIDEEPAQ